MLFFPLRDAWGSKGGGGVPCSAPLCAPFRHNPPLGPTGASVLPYIMRHVEKSREIHRFGGVRTRRVRSQAHEGGGERAHFLHERRGQVATYNLARSYVSEVWAMFVPALGMVCADPLITLVRARANPNPRTTMP